MHSNWHILTILNVGRHITFWCLAFYKYGNGRSSICLKFCGFNENDWYILYHLQWTLYSIQPNVFLYFTTTSVMWAVGIERRESRRAAGSYSTHCATVPRVLFTWREAEDRQLELWGALGTPAMGLRSRSAREKVFPSNLLFD
jgi:hypothetical protein